MHLFIFSRASKMPVQIVSDPFRCLRLLWLSACPVQRQRWLGMSCRPQAESLVVVEEGPCTFALSVWSSLPVKGVKCIFCLLFFFNTEAQFNCILFSSMQVKTPKMGETAEIKKNPRRKATKPSWSLGSRCRCPLSRAFTSHYLRTRAMWPPRSHRQVKKDKSSNP